MAVAIMFYSLSLSIKLTECELYLPNMIKNHTDFMLVAFKTWCNISAYNMLQPNNQRDSSQ